VIFCHRPDYDTPLEETCRALHWVIEQGLAFYWGTSEWEPDHISKAIELCDRLGLHKPIVEQPQYNMLVRGRVEKEYRRLFSDYKLGTTVWSPVAGGILSGKYNDGTCPDQARLAVSPDLAHIFKRYFGTEAKKAENVKRLTALGDYAKSLGATQT